MGSIGTEENLNVKPEGEEEVKSSEGEDPETLSDIDGADQATSYIIHFANAVELYQKKNWNCFGMAVLTILWKIVQRISARSPEKSV